ncbi:MAG: hypothetical protein ACI8QZ_003809 [Chlamydiales bacterium]|jgi:hypothetical protein
MSAFFRSVLLLTLIAGVHGMVSAEDGERPSEEPLGVPDEAAIASGIDEALAYLLKHQELYEPDPAVGSIPDAELASWQEQERERLREQRVESGPGSEWPYEGVYRVGADWRIPAGYRVGGTAIACLALLGAPGWEGAPERHAAVARGTQFMLERIEADPDMAPGPKQGYDVRGWGHVYAMSFLLRALDLQILTDPATRKQAEETIPHLVYCIAENEEPGGGWNYAGRGTSPFMTGATLLALFHANARGYEVDGAMVERALDALEGGRTGIGSFAYSGTVAGEVAMPGSSARAAIAELCLFRAGRSSEARLRAAVHGFFEGWDDLFDRKSKQGTHEGPYNIAPYYFYFGHTYAAIAIEHLSEGSRAAEREQLLALLWRTREADGSWNDRVFPRTGSYATAMGILALVAPALPAVEAWTERN